MSEVYTVYSTYPINQGLEQSDHILYFHLEYIYQDFYVSKSYVSHYENVFVVDKNKAKQYKYIFLLCGYYYAQVHTIIFTNNINDVAKEYFDSTIRFNSEENIYENSDVAYAYKINKLWEK